MPSSPASERSWWLHFLRRQPNFPKNTTNSVTALCGAAVNPLKLTSDAAKVGCEECLELMDLIVTAHLSKGGK
jgi:hypothetical protein